MIILRGNYEEKIKYEPQIIKIDEKNYIKKIILEKRGNEFTDIVFNNCDKEIFIGRYESEAKKINTLYNNGRILVYTDEYIKEVGKTKITEVHTLYDILDDIHYSMKAEELLNLFDPNLETNFLKQKNKLIIRSDIEKKHRLKK